MVLILLFLMNEKMVLLNIDLADVGTFFVVLWPLMALFLSILCWCSIGTPPKRSKEPGFKGLLQMWSTPAYHAVLSLLVRWTGGKHRGLQAWDVTPKTVRMCSFGVLLLSPREPAHVSARASRCLRGSQPMSLREPADAVLHPFAFLLCRETIY